MHAFYGHAPAAPPTRFTQRGFLDVTQRYGPLAVALNVDGERVVDESAGTGEEALNAALLSGAEAGLHPSRRGNRYPVTQPPFSAVLVRAGITFTCGGPATDAEMRMLRQATSSSTLPLVRAASGEIAAGVIPGLLAAGCDVGDVSGAGYMGGLATALVTVASAAAIAER